MTKRTDRLPLRGILYTLSSVFISIGKPFFKIFLFLFISILKIFQIFLFLARAIFFLVKNLFKLLLFILFLPFKLFGKAIVFLFSKTISFFQKIFKAKPKQKVKKVKEVQKKEIKKIHLKRLRTSAGLVGFVIGSLLATTIIYYLFIIVFKDLPSPQKLLTRQQALTTKIYDRDGALLYKIYRGKDRTVISLDELPSYLVQATIAIEDKDFYHHQGLSLRGILRAAYQNIIQHQMEGGSTITQQLIKNALLTPEKTWERKVKEAILAISVEKKYSKNQILEMYFNEVGYGGAAYGIEEASQKYFGKAAKDLDLAEASLLAGLPVSPTRYSPFGSNPASSKERQVLVLNRMVEDGYITDEQRQIANSEILTFAPQENEIHAPHFVMYVKELLAQKYGEQMLEQGGLEVRTSLDLNVQDIAQKTVADEIKNLGNYHITNGATLITNPKTGEILAMVGSKDYFATDIDGNYNVTTALRQPGSSIKPVNYSLALENGFTLGSLIDDSPITYQIPGSEPYSPTNYDHRFHGQVPLRIALASSYNVPAVKILATFGVRKMIERGKEMGITTWDDPSRFGLSLTLGGGEVKMTDMATVYGVIANNGVRVDLNPILEIKDSTGKILEKNDFGKETPVLNPGVAFLLTNILSDNNARTPAFGPSSQLNIPNRTVAVKTGTTQNMRDNWTIGYTPSRLVAVWVGNNNNTPMSYVASGVTGASPIWRKIMDNLLANYPIEDFSKPDEIKEVNICSITNSLSCDGCPSIRKEYFLSGTEPKYSCTAEKIKEILDQRKPTSSPQIL